MKKIELTVSDKKVIFDLSSMSITLQSSGEVCFNGHRATSSSDIYKYERINFKINEDPQMQIRSQICYRGDTLNKTGECFNQFSNITVKSIAPDDEYEEKYYFGQNHLYDSISNVIHSVIAPNINMPVKWVEKVAQEYINISTATHKK